MTEVVEANMLPMMRVKISRAAAVRAQRGRAGRIRIVHKTSAPSKQRASSPVGVIALGASAAVAGAMVSGFFSLAQVQLQSNEQAKKDQIATASQVYGRFLLAIDNVHDVANVPHDLPLYSDASAALRLADVNLFLYGSPKILEAGNQLEVALGWELASKTVAAHFDAAAYDRSYGNFVDVFRAEVKSP